MVSFTTHPTPWVWVGCRPSPLSKADIWRELRAGVGKLLLTERLLSQCQRHDSAENRPGVSFKLTIAVSVAP